MNVWPSSPFDDDDNNNENDKQQPKVVSSSRDDRNIRFYGHSNGLFEGGTP